MNLYLIDRTDDVGYDEFDSAIIAEDSPELAMKLAPFNVEEATCKLIGKAAKGIAAGMVLGSFNAG